MRFRIICELEQEIDVEDKLDLTEEQIKELRREFFIILENVGFYDLLEEVG